MTEPMNSDIIPNPSLESGLPQVEDISKRAVELFQEGRDCQEAVMAAFDEALGLGLMEDFNHAPRRRGGLAASSICGSLVGATSVLLGALPADDERSANLTLELLRSFREKYGTIACQNLTRQMRLGDYHAFCSQYVRSAVEGLHDVLHRNLLAIPSATGSDDSRGTLA